MGRSTNVVDVVDDDDVDVADDDAAAADDDDDVDEMREKSSSVCPNERHGESHKTLALRSQNALSRAAHPSWRTYIYIYTYIHTYIYIYISSSSIFFSLDLLRDSCG